MQAAGGRRYHAGVNRVPPEFRRRLAAHNGACWVAAGFSVFGAAAGWFALYAAFFVFSLVVEAIRTGEMIVSRPPDWARMAGGITAAAMLLWVGVDRYRKRFLPPPDRPIIGGHLLPEFLLLPARMTFSILDHLSARVTLGRYEIAEAWRLLVTIYERGRASITMLGMEFPDGPQLSRLLLALQFANWIDLHRGEEDWFYRLRSDEVENLRRLLPSNEPEN